MDNIDFSKILFVIPPSDTFQSDYDTDQLLCYCKYGTKIMDDQLCIDEKGCNSIIKLGNKTKHEATCKYNPANRSSSDDDGFVIFGQSSHSNSREASPTFSSPSYQSIDSSPFTKTSTSLSSSSSSTSSKSSSTIARLPKDPFSLSSDTSSTSSSSSSINPFKDQYVDDHLVNNQLWESSTQMFFCNRFCPNKDLGCMYFAKSEDNIQYHLDHECQVEKMKQRINQLESIVEKKELEIVNLRKSTSISTPTSTTSLLDNNNNNNTNNNKNTNINNKQLTNTDSFSSILLFILKSIKKSISKSVQKLKKLFKHMTTSTPSSSTSPLSYSTSYAPYEQIY